MIGKLLSGCGGRFNLGWRPPTIKHFGILPTENILKVHFLRNERQTSQSSKGNDLGRTRGVTTPQRGGSLQRIIKFRHPMPNNTTAGKKCSVSCNTDLLADTAGGVSGGCHGGEGIGREDRVWGGVQFRLREARGSGEWRHHGGAAGGGGSSLGAQYVPQPQPPPSPARPAVW